MPGYRDYRGIPSVAAWTWLPKYEIGVITEVDYDEAFRPLIIIQWMFAGIYTLLGLSSVAIFIFTLILARMRREAQKATIEAKQLGQYVLDQKLGAGAIGVVYEGHHAMLRRPTAIKLLNVDLVNEVSIQRFEREVQITSQLNHPNTVAIYEADGWWGRHERSQESGAASTENTPPGQKSGSSHSGSASSTSASGPISTPSSSQYDRTYIGNTTDE